MSDAQRAVRAGWGSVPIGDRIFQESCIEPLEAHLSEVQDSDSAAWLAGVIERARVERLPLIDPSGEVTFIYLAPEGATVELAGDLAGWDYGGGRGIPMSRRDGTRVHSATVSLPPEARIEYLFRSGSWSGPDPGAHGMNWNGFRRQGRRQLNASFAMPGYRDEFDEAIDPRASRGTSHEYEIDGRRVTVYFPASEALTTGSLPTLYIADGDDYAERTNVLEVLDTLVWRRELPPLICVLIEVLPRQIEEDARFLDYIASNDFADALAWNVVPFVDGSYPTDPARRFVVGVSNSAVAMGFVALREPELFAGAILQSPLLGRLREKWPQPAARGAQRWWVEMGAYDLETAGRPSVLEEVRGFSERLRASGHRVRYRELLEGHNWTSWRARLPAALRSLFEPA